MNNTQIFLDHIFMSAWSNDRTLHAGSVTFLRASLGVSLHRLSCFIFPVAFDKTLQYLKYLIVDPGMQI